MDAAVTTESFDLAVIGTGEGGSAPAMKCRKAGWRVAVIDDQPYGGTCALRGCDPKKVLVGAAHLVAWHKQMVDHGAAGDADIDWPALMRFKKSFTENVSSSREAELRKAGVVTLHGEARFVAADRIAVGEHELHTKHVVIAAGAGPQRLAIAGEDCLVTSTDFLELSALPRRIVFVGAGYIAFEFAHIAARAGAVVTVLGRRPLAGFDRDLVDRLVAHTREIGVDVRLGGEVVGIERRTGDGPLRIEYVTDGVPAIIEADLAVHAAGRVPNTAKLGASRGNVKLDEHGGVEVNQYLQSVTNPRVYATGDATLPPGKLPLTPVAAQEGAIVASNLLRGNTKQPDYRGTPSVAFTIPPLALVGMTEQAARELGTEIRVKSEDTSDWYSNRRTRTPLGAYKTIVDVSTDRLLGAHVLGEHADETINLFALAIRFGLPVKELKHAIYAYPTSGSDVSYML